MKRVGTVLAVFVAVLASSTVWAVVKTSAFRVEGMKNDVAVKRVTDAVKTVPGVQDAVGSAGSGVLMVRYDNARASAVDIGEAVGSAGYTLSPIEGSGTKDTTAAKAKTVLTDFAAVLSQSKEFVDKDRYGIVRNLAPAMKLRRDAVTSFEKASGQSSTQQLAVTLSKNVDKFTAAAEARDKAAAKAALPGLEQSFKALADARNLDDLLAPPVTTPGQPSKETIQQQLQDYITKVLGGK